MSPPLGHRDPFLRQRWPSRFLKLQVKGLTAKQVPQHNFASTPPFSELSYPWGLNWCSGRMEILGKQNVNMEQRALFLHIAPYSNLEIPAHVKI